MVQPGFAGGGTAGGRSRPSISIVRYRSPTRKRTSPSSRRSTTTLARPLRLGRTGQDHLYSQLVQPPSDDRVRPPPLRRPPLAEVPRVVGVERQRSTVLPQVRDRRPTVLRTVVPLHEARRLQPARRVVVDRDQRQVTRPSVLQPSVDRTVPLAEFSQRRPPLATTPVLRPLPPPLPQTRLPHPAAYRVRARPKPEARLQILRQQRASARSPGTSDPTRPPAPTPAPPPATRCSTVALGDRAPRSRRPPPRTAAADA